MNPAPLRTLLALLVTLATVFALARTSPPPAEPADAPAERFSAARAMVDIEALATAPRPIGSAANGEALAYLTSRAEELGLEVERQETLAVRGSHGMMAAGRVVNLIARLPGSASTGAVLLMAHYDSVNSGPGAGDDASGVATLLEAVRALQATRAVPAGGASGAEASGAEAPRNDVLLLFTDGEEGGLLGAQAFAEQHRWARDVKIVLNFEARGTHGPSLMFETSRGNGPLIPLLADTPRPIGTSFSAAVYRLMPNDTDFTVFRERGYAGYNFAFIGGATTYHTAQDSLDRLDPDSVQHHGVSALGLLRQLANINLTASELTVAGEADDAVYFNLPGIAFVHYPGSVSLPLTALLAVLLILLLRQGRRNGSLTVKGLALGALLSLLLAIGSAGLLLGGAFAAYTPYNFRLWAGWSSNSVYLVALALVAIGLIMPLRRRLAGRLGAANLAAGCLIVWLLLAVVTTLKVAGAAYLFQLPLAAGLIAGAATLRRRPGDRVSAPAALALALAVLLPALLWPPILMLFGVAMASLAAPLSGFVLVLLLLGPLGFKETLDPPAGWGRWAPAALAVAGLVLVLSARGASQHGPENRRPMTLYYLADAGSLPTPTLASPALASPALASPTLVTPTPGPAAQDEAGAAAGDTAGDSAGDPAGDSAGDTAGDSAGDPAGNTADDTAGAVADAGTEPTAAGADPAPLTGRWISQSLRAHPWLDRFLGPSPEQVSSPGFLGPPAPVRASREAAAPDDLGRPTVDLLRDEPTADGSGRQLTVAVRWPFEIDQLTVYLRFPDSGVDDAPAELIVDGTPAAMPLMPPRVPEPYRRRMVYFNPGEAGTTLGFTLPAGSSAELELIGQRFGLPAIDGEGADWPAELMPGRRWLADTTVVRATVRF